VLETVPVSNCVIGKAALPLMALCALGCIVAGAQEVEPSEKPGHETRPDWKVANDQHQADEQRAAPDLRPGVLRETVYDYKKLTGESERQAYIFGVKAGAQRPWLKGEKLDSNKVKELIADLSKNSNQARLELLVHLDSKGELPWTGSDAALMGTYARRLGQSYRMEVRGGSGATMSYFLAGTVLVGKTPQLVLEGAPDNNELNALFNNKQSAVSVAIQSYTDAESAATRLTPFFGGLTNNPYPPLDDPFHLRTNRSAPIKVKAVGQQQNWRYHKERGNWKLTDAGPSQTEIDLSNNHAGLSPYTLVYGAKWGYSHQLVVVRKYGREQVVDLGIDDGSASGGLSSLTLGDTAIVHRGEELSTETLEKLTNEWSIPYVRQTQDSQNKTTEQVKTAISLGDARSPSSPLIVYSALPMRRSVFSLIELWRMNIPIDQAREWSALKDALDQTGSELSLELKTPNKQELLNEFSTGTRDAIVLFAHNIEGTIYLSGLNGETLTSEDIDRIKRVSAPRRAIYLVTCSAGGVDGETISLAESLLKNNIAQTVFASEKDVDARIIPTLIRELDKSHTPRLSLHKFGFRQIVSLQHAIAQRAG